MESVCCNKTYKSQQLHTTITTSQCIRILQNPGQGEFMMFFRRLKVVQWAAGPEYLIKWQISQYNNFP